MAEHYPMQLSPDEAARALAAIDASRQAMRSAVRANRGHFHLWLWGAAWIAMALIAQYWGEPGTRLFPWIVLAGVVLSLVIGATQARRIRAPVDPRFFGVLAAVAGFALVAPLVLHPQVDARAVFAYIGLIAMLCHVIAGIWFDRYLLWLGLAIAGLILVGLFVFPGFFWWWIAVFGGGTMILTGVYVRYFWN